MLPDTLILPTTSDRIAMLGLFLGSLLQHPQNIHVHIHLQDNLGTEQAHRSLVTEYERLGLEISLQVSPELLSAYGARVSALKWLHEQGMHFEHYVNVDDDIEVTADTHWDEAIAKTDEPGVGFVITQWVRHPNQYDESAARLAPGQYSAPVIMIYNGGGMAYNAEVAAIMRELKVEPSQFEDLWPITAYRLGYNNYRALGSLAIHRTGSIGGRQAYVKQEPLPPLCQRWVNYRQLPGQWVGNNYSIPTDSDVRKKTKEEHARNRAERGWL